MNDDHLYTQPLQRLKERAHRTAQALVHAGGPLADSAAHVLACSDFVLDTLVREPWLLPALQTRERERLGGALEWPPPGGSPSAQDAGAQESFMAGLRRWRRAELARIAWRDLAGWASLDETLADLSNAADQALRAAHEFATRTLVAGYGQPMGSGGEPQQLMIVAMGKLGGRELNFSSDVDLVLLYAQDGETDRGALSNQEFFTRLAQLLVRLLAQPTAEGLVYRVDLRLRPFGESGPPVCSQAALEDYLQIHGRDWERYAWVKARPVTAVERWGELFVSAVQPFVYRRYLDFGVLESLREMKGLIEREVRRRDLADDVKLGDGGIREIEFIVQSFQLIRGGQDRRLQHSSLRYALPLLAGAKLLPQAAVAELDRAYVFLRRLENCLQMWADQQVHALPAEEGARQRLSAAMGYDSWELLRHSLQQQRAIVAEHFRAVAFGERAPASGRAVGVAAGPVSSANLPEASRAPQPAPLPLSFEDPALLIEALHALGYAQAPTAARELLDCLGSATLRRLDEIGQRRLQGLLTVLVSEAARLPEPLAALRRLLRVLDAIGVRSAYFALLLHHERPRARLLQLARHGDFLCAQIAAHPLLLDELIDERLLEQVPDRAALAADLEERMAGADQADEEQLLERLRQFQRAALFRVAVADLLLQMPVMRVSDRLTDVAELIVERALTLAWQHLTRRLGTPMCAEGAARRAVNVVVIGYGKLGGMELGYASDLDLVFLHDSIGAQQETDAPNPVDNQVFFVRFAQRLVHLLTVHSPAGRLYEVDMRLRPSGRAGLLTTSIEAFEEYQRREAWTYEHQALLHARAVAGASALRERFEDVRRRILAHAVHRDRLREDVLAMRKRMREELSRAGAGEFDLKQDPGGIADIEFLAQYWALRWAESYPPVATFADTIRQLESVGSADLVPQMTIDTLTATYRTFRACLHHRALDGLGPVLPGSQLALERSAVVAIWLRYLEGSG